MSLPLLLEQLKQSNLHNISIVLISTTAKSAVENRVLPSSTIEGHECLNIILNDEDLAEPVFRLLDKPLRYFFIDVERKQDIPLWQLAKAFIKNGIVLPYKPNDITREAAYALISQFFDYDLNHKNFLLYGSGNIAAKLALYLAEHEASVSLFGRNTAKLELLKESMNAILPSFSTTPIRLHSKQPKQTKPLYDALISAVSSEHGIDASFIPFLKEDALVLDIGINNLSPEFIRQAQIKSMRIFRLDVRIGSPFLAAILETKRRAFLRNDSGYALLNNVPCVAGGAIGDRGALILDNISGPKRIIGIANGTGGLKKHEEYNETDLCNIKNIEALL